MLPLIQKVHSQSASTDPVIDEYGVVLVGLINCLLLVAANHVPSLWPMPLKV